MATETPTFLAYKRSRFSTRLPLAYRYSPSHAWLECQPGTEDVWRVGLTQFATRMLGDMVDHGLETPDGAAIKVGGVVGWVEGFKAISDLYSVVNGRFLRSNPDLKSQVNLISKHPYSRGWIYEVQGQPDPHCMDVQSYRDLLDQAIDRILEKQKAGESS